MFKSAKSQEDIICYMDGQKAYNNDLGELIDLSVDGV
jgi:hypothetical protein